MSDSKKEEGTEQKKYKEDTDYKPTKIKDTPNKDVQNVNYQINENEVYGDFSNSYYVKKTKSKYLGDWLSKRIKF